MNTRIGHIARRQSRIGGFAPSLSLELAEESSSNGGDDASGSEIDDKLTAFQWFTICHSWQKRGVVLYMRVVTMLGGEIT